MLKTLTLRGFFFGWLFLFLLFHNIISTLVMLCGHCFHSRFSRFVCVSGGGFTLCNSCFCHVAFSFSILQALVVVLVLFICIDIKTASIFACGGICMSELLGYIYIAKAPALWRVNCILFAANYVSKVCSAG